MTAKSRHSLIRTQFLRRLVLYEGAGFFLILIFIWIDEIADLERRKLTAALLEGLLESAIVVGLAALVMTSTLRAARKIAHLEAFLVMCSWCRRVRHDDEWMSFETYLQKYGTQTSHGLCPACEARISS